MNTYQMEAETAAAASHLAEQLNKAGLEAEYNRKNTRDYLSKVSVKKQGIHAGNINVYSDAKGRITLRFHELADKELIPLVQQFQEQAKEGKLEQSREKQNQPTNSNTTAPIHVYTDGSFRDNQTGYGVAIINKQGERIHEACGSLPNSQTRQINGEIAAVLYALKWAEEKKEQNIAIHADYQGILSWADGSFAANSPEAKNYLQQLRQTPITVEFHKAVAHTDNRWNNRADTLANHGRQIRAGQVLYRDNGEWQEKPWTPPGYPRQQENKNGDLANARLELKSGHFDLAETFIKENPAAQNEREELLKIAHSYGYGEAVRALTEATPNEQHAEDMELAIAFGSAVTVSEVAIAAGKTTEEVMQALQNTLKKRHDPKFTGSHIQQDPEEHAKGLEKAIRNRTIEAQTLVH